MENLRKHKNTILGVLALIVGSLLLMDNLNIIDVEVTRYIFSWKTLLILLGIFILVGKQKVTGGIILISLGVTLWLPAVFNYQITTNQIFLPAVLITAGSLVLLNNYMRNKLPDSNNDTDSNKDAEIIEVDTVEL